MSKASYLGTVGRPRIVRIVSVVLLLWLLHFFIFGDRSWSPIVSPSSNPQPAGKHGPTWTLVVASTKDKDTNWVNQQLPEVQSAIYVVDNAKSKNKVPTSKGHEAMVYLTHIIDNYHSLSDVTVFIHTHQRAQHTDELLHSSMITSLQRLRLTKVTRDGYFNLRCSWEPGCPEWLNLRNASASAPETAKDETDIMRTAWRELLPASPVPEWISQPAGSQFAASREKIQAVPLALWTSWRDWLIRTSLTDGEASRVWEFMWQYALLGQATACPPMVQCYCEGYGVCFTSATKFVVWRAWWREAQDWSLEYLKIEAARPGSRDARELKDKIDQRNEVLNVALKEAMRWGDELRDRGEESSHFGRQLTEEQEKAAYSS